MRRARSTYKLTATLVVNEAEGETFESVAARWRDLDPFKAVVIEGRRIGEAAIEELEIGLERVEMVEVVE